VIHDDRHGSERRHKAATTPGKMPPVVRLPKPVQGVLLSGFRRWFQRNAQKRYGPSSPSTFRSSAAAWSSRTPRSRGRSSREPDDLMNVQPNLSRIFGPVRCLHWTAKEHRARRKRSPRRFTPEHQDYEKVIEEETLRETANWPEAPNSRAGTDEQDHADVILRTVFGPTGRTRLPRAQSFRRGQAGSRMATLARSAISARGHTARGAGRGIPPNFEPHVFRAHRQGQGDRASTSAPTIPGALLRSRYEMAPPMVAPGWFLTSC